MNTKALENIVILSLITNCETLLLMQNIALDTL